MNQGKIGLTSRLYLTARSLRIYSGVHERNKANERVQVESHEDNQGT